MNETLRWTIGLLALLLFLCGIAGYYVHALKSLRIEGIHIDDIGLTDGNPSIAGTVSINNPSLFPIQIGSITYDLALKGTDGSDIHLGSGKIDGERIPAGKSVTVPILQTFEIAPSILDAALAPTRPRINLIVTGKASSSFLGIVVHVPFRYTYDVRPLVESKMNALAARAKNGIASIFS